jgi:hypothetical protein
MNTSFIFLEVLRQLLLRRVRDMETEEEESKLYGALVAELIAVMSASKRKVVCRTSAFWKLILKDMDPQEFRESLRMTRHSFDVLLSRLFCPYGSNMLLRKKLAVFLWRMAHGEAVRPLGQRFGIGKSTVVNSTAEVLNLIVACPSLSIRFPSPAEQLAISEDFKEACHIPYIVGAIDGSHIKIRKPHLYHEDYFNRKHTYSFQLQAVVDKSMKFRDVRIVSVPSSCIVHLRMCTLTAL